jgi:hypothetical protein
MTPIEVTPGLLLTMRFDHEPHWQPTGDEILHDVRWQPRKRLVRGRTLCTLIQIIRHPNCPKHGDGLGAPVDATDAPKCLCRHTDFAMAFAYCSRKDTYTHEAGRRASLAKVLQASFGNRDNRHAIWQNYFNRPRPNGSSWISDLPPSQRKGHGAR